MKREALISVFLIVFSVLTPVVLHAVGTAQRSMAHEREVVLLQQPRHTIEYWNTRSVYGRILYLFDTSLHVEPDESGSADSTFVLQAALNGTVRIIRHIVPSADWERAEKTLSNAKGFSRVEGGFRGTVKGIPLDIRPLVAIEPPTEPVLVYIDPSSWTSPEEETILALLSTGAVPADLVAVVDESSSFATALQRRLD